MAKRELTAEEWKALGKWFAEELAYVSCLDGAFRVPINQAKELRAERKRRAKEEPPLLSCVHCLHCERREVRSRTTGKHRGRLYCKLAGLPVAVVQASRDLLKWPYEYLDCKDREAPHA